MDEQPSKRRGRPRKALPVCDDAEKAKSADHNDAGNGEVGAVGPTAQADAGGPGEGWDSFVDRVKAHFHADNRLRNVWHPDPREAIITTDNGNLNVFTGPHKGQLNNGEHVEIQG